MKHERKAVDAALAWLRDVEPQLGSDVDYAQVDIDTLLPVRGQLQKNLTSACLAAFKAVASDPCFERRELYWELSIPDDHGELLTDPPAGTDVSVVLAGVDFTGRLRGRRVPGFFLSTRPFPDRLLSKLQRTTRLAWSEMPACVALHRAEVRGVISDPLDVVREDAVVLRSYPDVMWREAKFPLDS